MANDAIPTQDDQDDQRAELAVDLTWIPSEEKERDAKRKIKARWYAKLGDKFRDHVADLQAHSF